MGGQGAATSRTDWSRTFTATQARRSSSEWRQVRIPTCTTATASRPRRKVCRKGQRPVQVSKMRDLARNELFDDPGIFSSAGLISRKRWVGRHEFALLASLL